MKKLWGLVGYGLFWLGWPAWVVYFRFSGTRSRVLVVCNDEVLLVKGWLGTNQWCLPGGGVKKGEQPIAAAVRELCEETGVTTPESNLTQLGSYKHTQHGFNYNAQLFCLRLPQKPQLRMRKGEILDAAWFQLNSAHTLKLDDEARLAIRLYNPLEQRSLL